MNEPGERFVHALPSLLCFLELGFVCFKDGFQFSANHSLLCTIVRFLDKEIIQKRHGSTVEKINIY